MHKRNFFIIVAALIIALIAVGVILWKKQSNQKSESLIVAEAPTTTPKEEMATWDDPAGFTFQYPKTIVIDKHDEDKENYAHLEFKNGQNPSVLYVWAKDVTVDMVGAWIKGTKEFASASTLDTTLGGLAAKKIVMSEPAKTMIVATVSDQIVFYAELRSAGDSYWQMVFDTVIKSFEFTGDDKPNDTVTSNDGSDDIVIDEEETIE